MPWSAGAILTAAQLNAHAPQERTSYTPAISSGGTTGNAACIGSYSQHGKTVHFRARITLGTTSAVTGVLKITLPVAAPVVGGLGLDGVDAIFSDASGNFYFARGFVDGTTATLHVVGVNGAAASTSATVPFTWVTNDVIYVTGTYEAA